MITILTANYKTKHFIEVLEQSLFNNTPNLSEILISSPEPLKTKYAKVIPFRSYEEPGSANHGAALNYLVPLVKTEYTLIIDSDCFIFHRNWDIALLSLSLHYRLIGAEAFRVDTKTQTRLLHANFLFGFTKDFQQVDFRPNFQENIDTAGNLSIFLKDAPKLEIRSRLPTQYFQKVHCAEYYYQNHILWYHFGRAVAQRGGEENKNEWLAEANRLLSH